jgi:hypothetical protein
LAGGTIQVFTTDGLSFAEAGSQAFAFARSTQLFDTSGSNAVPPQRTLAARVFRDPVGVRVGPSAFPSRSPELEVFCLGRDRRQRIVLASCGRLMDVQDHVEDLGRHQRPGIGLGPIVMSDDPVAADFTCARLMGLDPFPHLPPGAGRPVS